MRVLRREWLSGLVLVVGFGYVWTEFAIRPHGELDPWAVPNALLQSTMVLLLVVGIFVAVRQRESAVRALDAGEGQLVRLLMDAHDPICVAQRERIVLANAAAGRLMRLTGGETMMGRHVLDLVPATVRDRRAQSLARIREIGQVATLTTAVVRPDGSMFEAEIAAVAIRFDGHPALQLVVRDVSDERAGALALAESERRLRRVLDGMPLVALSITSDGTIRYANRATDELLGRAAGSLVGTSVFELAAFGDPEATRAAIGDTASTGAIDRAAEARINLPDGNARTIRWHLALADPADDAPDGGLIAIGEDITDARETGDRLRTLLANAPVGICAVDADGRVRLAQGGPFARFTVAGSLPPEPATIEELPPPFVEPLRAALRGSTVELLLDLAGRTYETTFMPVTPGTAGAGGAGGAVGIVTEVTLRTDLERQGTRLTTAVDQSSDAVMITDRAGIITYVNPAFERVSGFGAADAIGRRPNILRSGAQNRAFYAALWGSLEDGMAWTGELVNRRRDGTLFRELATITPVCDRDGEIVSFVAVKRDITHERELEEALAREMRERAAIVLALQGIAASGDPATIATALCQAVVGLPDIDFAGAFTFEGPDARALAYEGPPEIPVASGRILPASRAAYLQARSALGPWAEPWRVRIVDGGYGQSLARAGVKAIAYIPLRDDAGVFGVLGLGTRSQAGEQALQDRLPALSGLGLVASSHLSAAVRRAVSVDEAQRDLEQVIAAGAFRSVFQPIVDLRTGVAIGFEALTRFSSGVTPEVAFRQAASLGLAERLETAAIERAVSDARSLPAGAFLTLNVSSRVALQMDDLASAIGPADRPLVLEITGPAESDDYRALVAMAHGLPVPARLAVDDAGGGFANLRHMLQLTPDYVKVNRSLVQGIDRDPARQAMLSDLRHEASRRGIALIAEGIETSSELTTVTGLSLRMGQGFLLGHPAPVSEVSHTSAAVVVGRAGRDGGAGRSPA